MMFIFSAFFGAIELLVLHSLFDLLYVLIQKRFSTPLRSTAALGVLPFKFLANTRIDTQLRTTPKAIQFSGEMRSKLG